MGTGGLGPWAQGRQQDCALSDDHRLRPRGRQAQTDSQPGQPPFFKLLVFYRGRADEQGCDSFRWTVKGLSPARGQIHSPPHAPATQAAT